mmetsp:Transcript_19174/g.21713  ORF Transcript_19174/g.21713 Transcript_19174/m.21713 type:complete len:87 (-) Transcript_19174:28-288(-)
MLPHRLNSSSFSLLPVLVPYSDRINKKSVLKIFLIFLPIEIVGISYKDFVYSSCLGWTTLEYAIFLALLSKFSDEKHLRVTFSVDT